MFFTPSRPMTIAEIAALTGAVLRRPELGKRKVKRLAALDNSDADSLVFIIGKKQKPQLADLQAAAAFCSADIADKIPAAVAPLISRNPHGDFSHLARVYYPEAVTPSSLLGEAGIAAGAFVHPAAKLAENVTVEAGAAIGRNAVLGAGSVVCASAIIGENCRIGKNCYIGPAASIQYAQIGDGVHLHAGVRIGQDGFGYVGSAQGVEKVPQIGGVRIEDNVEIGANSTVDRGALNDTVIGAGTKIDNLVQIAHNVRIGRFCLIAAHCGISGSCVIGDGTQLGGRVGLADHLHIGAGVQIAAASGVMNDIPDGEKWGGIPARPFRQWFREVAALRDIVKPGKRK